MALTWTVYIKENFYFITFQLCRALNHSKANHLKAGLFRVWFSKDPTIWNRNQFSDAIWISDWFSNGWNKMVTKNESPFENWTGNQMGSKNRSRFQMVGPLKNWPWKSQVFRYSWFSDPHCKKKNVFYLKWSSLVFLASILFFMTWRLNHSA